MKRVLLSWSTGKDSVWALHVLRHLGECDVVGLLTTVNQSAQRVAMHAVRRSLLESQAVAVGLPVTVVDLPWPCSNQEYSSILSTACNKARCSGVDAIAFGDLFLQDIRTYREAQMKDSGLEPIFPLWGLPTGRLAHDMIHAGLRARLTCVDLKKLPESFAGREFDLQLLADLPPHTDPCGENGEFHTFCYAGPVFSSPIQVTPGELVTRDGFAFADFVSSAN